MPLIQGQLINNRFRVIKLLGKGGFGAVYCAWDLNFELPCAIKENSETSPEAQRQFLREGRLLRTLRHPNLVQVTDYFVVPNPNGSSGAAYLVMDYIDGEDLAEALRKNGGPIDESQAVKWIGQVCDALDYLHNQRPPVIHRDVKPANIKVAPDGHAMLVDFGIAKVYDATTPTTIGARAVTPGFSPMEQYGSGGHTDAHTDIYALGATLYMLLTGNPPPEAPDRHCGTKLEPISTINPHVSAPVERAIEKALELLPKNRWESVLAFKAALCGPPTAMVQVTRPSHEGKTQKTSFATIPLQEASLPRRIAAANEKPAAPKRSAGLMLAMVILIAVVLVMPLLLSFSSGERAFAWLTTQTVEGRPQQVTPGPNLSQTAEAQRVTHTARAVQTEKTLTAAAISTEASAAVVRRQQTEAAQATKDAENTAIALTPTAYPPTILSQDARMALIPGGDFQMGAEDGDIDERPVHTVFTDAFYMDVYEVTNVQFVEFLNHPGEMREDEFSWWISDPSYGFYSGIEKVNKVWQAKPTYERHPVTWVTWFGAQAYCAWRGARLPTEAEWEKAARGGLEGMKYPWGDEMPVCTRGAKNGAQFDDCPTGTATIGYFGPNGYGLYDMAGNVMEWVADWYLRKIYLNFTPDNPTGPRSGELRVTRGGAWTLNLNYLMVADRTPVDPKFTDNRLGFRCAKRP